MLKNEVRLFGYLANDPIWLKQTNNPALRLYVAHNRSFKNKETQDWVQKTSYIPVIVWHRERANYIYQNIKKGDLVGLRGELWYESQEKPIGSGKYTNYVNVSCDEIWLISKTHMKTEQIKVPNFKTQTPPEMEQKLLNYQSDEFPNYDDYDYVDDVLEETESIDHTQEVEDNTQDEEVEEQTNE